MHRLNCLIAEPRYGIIGSAIRKIEFSGRPGAGRSPYDVALEFGLERVFLQLQLRSQVGRKTFVIFEARGRTEDAALEVEFERIMTTTRMRGMAQTLKFQIASKQTNSTGLQLADMVARPIGIHLLRPTQPNRAWDILEPKMVRSREGRVLGYGLKVYPSKRKASDDGGRAPTGRAQST